MKHQDRIGPGTHTRWKVEFHSDQNPGGGKVIKLGAGTSGEESPSPMGHLVSVNTHKAFDGVSGTFTIVVKRPPTRRITLKRVWRDPEDVWVQLWEVVEGQSTHVMLGLIDSIKETVERDAKGKRVEVTTIIGRDHGKVLEVLQCWVNFYVKGDTGLRSMRAYLDGVRAHERLPKNPVEWVKMWLEVWLGNNNLSEHQFVMPSSLGMDSFYNYLNKDTMQKMDGGNGTLTDASIAHPDIDQGMGTLWDLMTQYSNDILNEMWVDMGPGDDPDDPSTGRPAVYMRQRPFPSRKARRDKWNTITQHVLEKEDLGTGHELSKGGAANRYNFWMIRFDGNQTSAPERATMQQANVDGAAPGQPGSVPIVNKHSIARHGVRKWEKGSIFLQGLAQDGEKAQSWYTVAANWLRRCHDWYSVAPMQLSGTLRLSRAFPRIRIGHRILVKASDGDIEFYVEGVDQAWRYPGRGNTTLTVTRGEYTDENLLDFVYEQLENPQILTPEEQCIGVVPDSVGLDDALQSLTQGCIFEPPRRGEVSEGDGFELSTDAATQLGKSLLSEVAAGGISGEGGDVENADPGMLPMDDVEDHQATEIAEGNNEAKVATVADGPFGQAELERGDDPLVGYDTFTDNDPIAGLEI